MLEQLAPIPILTAALAYSAHLYRTKAGRSQTGMQRAAGLVLIVSGVGFAVFYWVTATPGHERDAAIRFILVSILWSGLALALSRQGTTPGVRAKVAPFGS
jgi:dipeptide/tripeptide permease